MPTIFPIFYKLLKNYCKLDKSSSSIMYYICTIYSLRALTKKIIFQESGFYIKLIDNFFSMSYDIRCDSYRIT